MKSYRPLYKNVENWQVLDKIDIHDFSAEENSFSVVQVLIGDLQIEEVDLNQHYVKAITPITRWISYNEFMRLKKHAGTVIW